MQKSDPFHRFTISTANYLSPANASNWTVCLPFQTKKSLQYLHYHNQDQFISSNKNLDQQLVYAINFWLIYIYF